MKLTQSHEKKRELFLFQLLVCAEKLLSGPGSQLRQSLQIAESSQWQTEKKKKLFNRYSFPTAFSKFSLSFSSPCWSRGSCLSYLVEFVTRLNNFSRTGLFIAPGRGMSPCGEEGRGWRCEGCVSPWRWTSAPCRLSQRGDRVESSMVTCQEEITQRTHTHTQSQSLYTVHSSVLQMSYHSS